ncbi:hypothetical protein ACP4OV_011443 [Aristida adscensionis]
MEGENEAVLVVCGEECDAAPVFDINTGEEILQIPDCVAPPSSLACAAGHLLAASRSDKDQPTSSGANKDQLIFGGAIYFWDPNKLQESHKSFVEEAIGPIACSKDGIYLVGGTHSGNAYIWEILLQVEESKPHEAMKYCAILNTIKHEASITGIRTILGGPCPTLITSSLDGSSKVTELVSGRLLHMLALSSPVTTTAIDPLEQLLICGADDGSIYVMGLHGIGTQYLGLKLSKNDCQVLCAHKAPISALALSCEGVRLVSGSKDGIVLIWDTTTWSVIRKLENKMGPVTNLLVIQKPKTSRVRTRNSLTLEIPMLEKIFKPSDETPTFLQPSGFSQNADSTHACFQSSNLLREQILDLEGKRTPEAMEMIISETIDEQMDNQDLAQELGDMVTVMQWQTLNAIEARLSME